jgi:hypothetical protein
MKNNNYQTNSIDLVFNDSNLVLYILSFLYEKTNRPNEFLTNTPITLHILSFKSLYYEFHKLPNLQIVSHPIQYLSSFSVFKWAVSMGYSGNIFNPNNFFDYSLFNDIVEKHKDESIYFIDYAMTKISSFYHYCSIANYAIMHGYSHLLEQINTEDTSFEWDSMTYLEYATESGHLHIIKWLRSQDPPCPWPSHICNIAAKYGHLHVLQWLRTQNPPCPWSSYTYTVAAKSGHLHILQWLHEQDPPCPCDDEHMYEAAASSGHLHILLWLREQHFN